jgi:hypothetical protein
MPEIAPPVTIIGRDINGQIVEMLVEKLVWRPSVYALIFNAAGELLVQDNIKTQC